MLTCYLDESGTDNDSPVAVVGGLLLMPSGFFWLDVDWRKAAEAHNITLPIHMREFTPHGLFASVGVDARRALFADLVRIVNDHKTASVGAVLASEAYRRVFAGVTDMSMYAACFAQSTFANDLLAPKSGYLGRINYVLDDGNAYKKDIREGYDVLQSRGVNIGALSFEKDDSNYALQAADMISWSVRRTFSGALRAGFEPLSGLFREYHVKVPYEQEWMHGVADKLREQFGYS